MKTVHYFILVLFLSICYCISDVPNNATCDSNKCYHSVNTTYQNLLELFKKFNSTISSAEPPYNASHYKGLGKDLNKVQRETKKIVTKLNNYNNSLNQCHANLTNSEKITDEMREKLLNVSKVNSAAFELNSILTQAKEKYENFKELVGLKRNVSETCKVAKVRFREFNKAVKNVSNTTNQIKENYEDMKSKAEKINKELNETAKETIINKNNFEQLKIPDSVLEDFVNQTEKELLQIVNYLKNNAKLLKELLEAANKRMSDRIAQESDAVKEKLSEIKTDLDIMNEGLKQYEDAFIKANFTPTVDDEYVKLLELIKKDIEDLEKRMARIDFTDEEKTLLRKNYESVKSIREKRNKLIQYQLLLDAISTSEEKLEEIDAELIRFKITIELIQQLEKLEEESEHLKKLRDEVVKLDCSLEGVLT